MKFPWAFCRRRGLLFGFVALLATVSHCSAQRPPERSLEGLSQLLGGAIGGVVKPEELIWEPGRGVFEELLLGRRVLFLGKTQRGSARDLYRARVRVTLDGQPLSVGALHNVTDTPVGDDAALEARGDRATFATLAFGRIQGLSVLDHSATLLPTLATRALHTLRMLTLYTVEKGGSSRRRATSGR